MSQHSAASGVAVGHKTAILKHNGLTVDCVYSGEGKLQKKTERQRGVSHEYAYRFDDKGHLLTVVRDGRPEEEYQYNRKGQRIEQWRGYGGASDTTEGRLDYDEVGRLARAGETNFEYDGKGALSERCDCQGITRFFYNGDTLLNKVTLPSGEDIRYEYEQGGMPQRQAAASGHLSGKRPPVLARRFKNGMLTNEYAWRDALRLAGYRDHEHGLEYAFAYDASGRVDRVRITPLASRKVEASSSSDWLGGMVTEDSKERLRGLLGGRNSQELFCGCDQVGTLKLLTDGSGRVVKERSHDSFGFLCDDTLPDLFLPIGFAGGLADPDTGLVRFGWRDYDPSVGRFTAPDPLGDTGGDHDLYDYCVDDPVSMNDPVGLFPPALLFLGYKALALLIAGGGAYGAAYAADKIKSKRDGEESSAAVGAMNKIAPVVGKAWWDSTLPGRLVLGNPAMGLGSQFTRQVAGDSRRLEE